MMLPEFALNDERRGMLCGHSDKHRILCGNHTNMVGLARERSTKISLLSFFDRPDDYSKMLSRMAVITGILVFISWAFLIQALSEKGVALPSPKVLAEKESRLEAGRASLLLSGLQEICCCRQPPAPMAISPL